MVGRCGAARPMPFIRSLQLLGPSGNHADALGEAIAVERGQLMCACAANCGIAHRPCHRIEAAHTTVIYGIGASPGVSAPWPEHHTHTRRETTKRCRRHLRLVAPLVQPIVMPAIDSRKLRFGGRASGDDLDHGLRKACARSTSLTSRELGATCLARFSWPALRL